MRPYLSSVASRTIRRAFWLLSSSLQECASNCFAMWSCRTGPTMPRGGSKVLLQRMQTPKRAPSASRLTIRSLRFGMIAV